MVPVESVRALCESVTATRDARACSLVKSTLVRLPTPRATQNTNALSSSSLHTQTKHRSIECVCARAETQQQQR